MALRLAGERYPSEGVFDTVTITDGAGHYLQVPKLTTAQRDALSPTNGTIIYNTTTGRFEAYDGGWDALNIANILTTKGDLFTRGASDIERLAIGTKRFFPRVNEAGDGLEYVRGYEFGMKIRQWQWELAFFDWTTTVTGSGSIVYQGYGQFRPYTGTTASSTARGRGYRLVWPNYANEAFEWYMSAQLVGSTTNGKVWMKIDADTAADPTDKALGWRIDDNALKGIVHNGTSLDVVDLSTTIADNQGAEYFLKFIPGSKVEWYVDGSKKGESTSIPASQLEASVYPVLAVANNADAAGVGMEIWRHGWILGA